MENQDGNSKYNSILSISGQNGNFNKILKIDVQKGCVEVVKIPIRDYLHWYRECKIIPYDNNRGKFGANLSTVALVRDHFKFTGLGAFHASVIKKTGQLELIDCHGRTKGMLERQDAGRMSDEDLKKEITMVLYNEEDRIDAYISLNLGIKHSTREIVTNPDLPIGKIYRTLLSRVNGKFRNDNIAPVLLDILIGTREGFFENADSVYEKTNAVRRSRGVMSRLIREQNNDSFDYPITDAVYHRASEAISFYLNFRTSLINHGAKKNKDGTNQFKKNGEVLTWGYVNEISKSVGILIVMAVDYLTDGELGSDYDEIAKILTKFDFKENKQKKKYDKFLSCSKMMAQRGEQDKVEDSYERIIRTLSGKTYNRIRSVSNKKTTKDKSITMTQ